MSSEKKVLSNNPFDAMLKGCKTTKRTKLSDIKRENAYNDIINNIGWSRFKYTGIPDFAAVTLTNEMIERAVCCGAGVVYKVPESSGSVSAGMWVCTPVEWTGVLKADNTSEHFITHLPDGDFSLTDEQIGKYVVIRNNFEMTSDYNFTEWTAAMLNETDISENQLIKWSRMTPIAKVMNAADASRMEMTLRRVYNGEPWAVIDDPSKLMTNGSQTSRDDAMLRLTDETAIEKMHFLSEFHYELIRRLCNLYNIPFHTTAKSAQNLESEIHNTDIFSRMYTENGLKWRRLAMPEFAKVFGDEWANMTVELGEMFKKENEVIENNIDENSGDNSKNVSCETTDGENNTGGGGTE